MALGIENISSRQEEPINKKLCKVTFTRLFIFSKIRNIRIIQK